MKPSKLQKALARGLQPGGDLGEEIDRLGEITIEAVEDAQAVCEALAQFPLPPQVHQGEDDDDFVISSPLHAIVSLFQEVGTEEAFAVLCEQGLPHLFRLFDSRLENADTDSDPDELLFLLKIFAMYRTEEGAQRVATAARKPLVPDDFMWSIILGQFDQEHPHAAWLVSQLADPLPQEFLAVALLDCANGLAIADQLQSHPFDTKAGKVLLHDWLTSSDEEQYSYAHSATASLPFLHGPERDQFLAIAMDHPDADVQLEAAWASAKLGSQGGLKCLARMCLVPAHAHQAAQYLTELGFEQMIPEQARDPEFQAMAEMCQWLAHPNEYGRAPDSIEPYDCREMYWPPTDDRRTLRLFKYCYKATEEDVEDVEDVEDEEPEEDEEGVGMVGATTFALMGETAADMLPEDIYALHCCWELEINEDPRAPRKRSVAAGRKILAKYNPS